MPEEQVQELLSEVDRDGNNRIDYDEFCRMLLPEMTGAEGQRRSGQMQRPHESGGGGSESPRHNVSTYYTARSGGWAASGAAHKVLPPAIEEE
jgi:hypothetical protein